MVTDRPTGEVERAPGDAALALGVFLGLAFALYGSTLSRYWLIDDLSYAYLGKVVFPKDPLFLLRPDMGIYWRPVVKLWFAIDALIWGYRPLGFRLTSVVLHAVASLLVFRLAGRLTKRGAVAWTAGLLFVLHPIHFAAVGWISARFDLACTVFTLAALLSLLSYLERPRVRSAIGVLVFQGLALFSKELAFTLPVLAAVVALVYGEGDRRSRLGHAAPILFASFTLLAVVLLARVAWMGGIGGPKDAAGASSLLARGPLGAAFNLMVSYLVAFFYPLAGGANEDGGVSVLGALGTLIALIVLGRRSGERRRALATFSLAFLAGLPFAPFIALNKDLGISYMFYLPSAFFAVGFGVILFGSRKDEDRPARIRAILVVLLAGLYVPQLIHNNARYGKAADRAQEMHDGVVRALGRIEGPARVYLSGFPTERNGALIFLDPNLIFLADYDTTQVRFVALDDAYLASHPEAPPLADEPLGVDMHLLRWADISIREPGPARFAVNDFSAELTDALEILRAEPRLRETRADPRRYLSDGWRYRVIEATAWEPAPAGGQGCAVTWCGYAASRVEEPGVEFGGSQRFPEPAACARVAIGADPRWVVTKYMSRGVVITTPGKRASEIRMY